MDLGGEDRVRGGTKRSKCRLIGMLAVVHGMSIGWFGLGLEG